MQTIKLPLLNEVYIQEYQRIYSSCFRYSFNRFKDGLNEKEIRVLVKDKFKLNSWLIQSCITEAKTKFKICKDTKVIFGSKDNWKKYINKEISKDEFKARRLMSIASIGEAPQHGNRLFSLDIINNNQIIFKPKHGIKFNLQLPKLRNNIKKQFYKLEEFAKQNKLAYTIHLSPINISISFDESLISEEKYKGKDERILGIDLNPNYIGISILEFNKKNEFKILYKEVIDFTKLTKKSREASAHKENKYLTNKREYEHYEAIKHIIKIAKSFSVSKIVIEELTNIHKDIKSKSKNVNRLNKGCWNRGKIVSNLKKRCNISNIELIEVNAAYSSFVGNMQYGSVDCPDMVASSIEIARRGYKKFEKGWFYPSEKNVENLTNLWKEDLDWSSLSWKKLFEIQKESKLKYRFPLNTNQEVLRLKSCKSCIQLYKFI